MPRIAYCWLFVETVKDKHQKCASYDEKRFRSRLNEVMWCEVKERGCFSARVSLQKMSGNPQVRIKRSVQWRFRVKVEKALRHATVTISRSHRWEILGHGTLWKLLKCRGEKTPQCERNLIWNRGWLTSSLPGWGWRRVDRRISLEQREVPIHLPLSSVLCSTVLST